MIVKHTRNPRTIVITSACQPPGAVLALAFARRGARVVAIDDDPEGLKRLSDTCPGQIEPLVMGSCPEGMQALFKDAWQAEPIDLIINLMPLALSASIDQHLRGLSGIVRTMGRGLVAGKGCLVSVVARPRDPLSLVAEGLRAAIVSAGVTLGRELARKSVRVHTVSVPAARPALALDTLMLLGSARTRHMDSTVIDLS